MLKKIMIVFLFVANTLLVTSVIAHERVFPETIPVPTGFQPEGVITGKEGLLYVGSLLDGAIYEIDAKDGEGELLVEGSAGRATVGMAYDRRNDRIFAAGGIFGNVFVYDAEDGEILASYEVGSTGSFVNDAIVTRKAVYFTDSFLPVIYRLPLGRQGSLPDESEIETIELVGDFEHIAGEFNANGIESSRNGKYLFIVNSTTGYLYRVNPETGDSIQVDLEGASLVNGDGLVKRGKRLWVVQNFLNQVTEIRLSHKGLEGEVTRIITNDNFQIPTTASLFGRALYVINARFDVAPPPLPGFPPADPSTTFDLIRVDLSK